MTGPETGPHIGATPRVRQHLGPEQTYTDEAHNIHGSEERSLSDCTDVGRIFGKTLLSEMSSLNNKEKREIWAQIDRDVKSFLFQFILKNQKIKEDPEANLDHFFSNLIEQAATTEISRLYLTAMIYATFFDFQLAHLQQLDSDTDPSKTTDEDQKLSSSKTVPLSSIFELFDHAQSKIRQHFSTESIQIALTTPSVDSDHGKVKAIQKSILTQLISDTTDLDTADQLISDPNDLLIEFTVYFTTTESQIHISHLQSVFQEENTDSELASSKNSYLPNLDKLPLDRFISDQHEYIEQYEQRFEKASQTADKQHELMREFLSRFQAINDLIINELKPRSNDEQHEIIFDIFADVVADDRASLIQLHYTMRLFLALVKGMLDDIDNVNTQNKHFVTLNKTTFSQLRSLVDTEQKRQDAILSSILNGCELSQTDLLLSFDEDYAHDIIRFVDIVCNVMNLISSDTVYAMRRGALLGLTKHLQEFSIISRFTEFQPAETTVSKGFDTWIKELSVKPFLHAKPEVYFFILDALNELNMIEASSYKDTQTKIKHIQSEIKEWKLSGGKAKGDIPNELTEAILSLVDELKNIFHEQLSIGGHEKSLGTLFHILGWQSLSLNTEDSRPQSEDEETVIWNIQGIVETLVEHFSDLVTSKRNFEQANESTKIMDIGSLSAVLNRAKQLKIDAAEFKVEVSELDSIILKLSNVRDELIEMDEDLIEVLYSNVRNWPTYLSCISYLENIESQIKYERDLQASNEVARALLAEEDAAPKKSKPKQTNTNQTKKTKNRKKSKRSNKKKAAIKKSVSDTAITSKNTLTKEAGVQAAINTSIHSAVSATTSLSNTYEDDDTSEGAFSVISRSSSLSVRSTKEYVGVPHLYQEEGTIICYNSAKLETTAKRFCEPLLGGASRHPLIMRESRHLDKDEREILQISSLLYHYDKHVDPLDKQKTPAELYALAGGLLSFFVNHYRDTNDWVLSPHIDKPKQMSVDAHGKCKYQMGPYALILKPQSARYTYYHEFISFCRRGIENTNPKLSHRPIMDIIDHAERLTDQFPKLEAWLSDYNKVITSARQQA